jgi:hypothetical protein
VVRPKRVVHVFYGFGDASGKGRGSTFQGFKTVPHPAEDAALNLVYKVGVWGTDVETESSNYRELANLVEDTEAEARSGALRDTELFLFTDNSTAESAFYKGSSSSKKLHALVLRLHKLALDFSIILHVIHVAGTRMIAQGTDGCSRGVLMEGVMAGKNMLTFINLDKSAIQRCTDLLPWICSWCGHSDIEPLTPEGWFQEGHGIIGGHVDKHKVWIPDHEQSGCMHLWAPPPAVADAMLEELLKARHKRTDTYDVVVIPRLMAPRWRRLFFKAVDVHFVIDPGNSFWPLEMYEPLFVGLILPYVPFRPWCLKRSPFVVGMGRKLREVCKEGDFLAGHLLRKLLKLPRRVARLSPQGWHAECYTCQGNKIFPLAVLYDDDGQLWEGQEQRSSRLNAAVPGAHAVIPFQCEICWIRNLEGRNVNRTEDRRYLACIRRANLDAINSRAKSTIKAHVSFMRRVVTNAALVNRTPFFAPRGPFPLADTCGMGWAVDLLLNSMFAKGRITATIQFGTFRKGRGTFSKTWQSSPQGVSEGNSFTGTGT